MMWGASMAVAVLMLAGPYLAASAMAQTQIPLSNAGPVIEALGQQLRDRSQPLPERVEMARVLGQWASPQVRGPLVAVLSDPDPALREEAARALGWPGNREAVSALRVLAEAPGETAKVRAAALQSLGRIGDDSARPVLLAAIADPEPLVRERALWGVALGPLATPADRVPLLLRLADDRALDLLLRCDALRALGRLPGPGVVETLMRLLEHEPPGRMPLPSGAPNQQEIMTIRYWQVRDVRAWSARGLGELDARAATPLLLKAVEDPGDFFLRLIAMEVLVTWDVRAAVPALVRRLEDPSSEVRITALMGLARFRDPVAVEPVAARLTDAHSRVRAQAVTTLAILGDPSVLPRLEALRHTEADSVVQEALLEALARLAP